MEDSNMFIQWAMSTMQHQHLAAEGDGCGDGDAAFPSLQALRNSSSCSDIAGGGGVVAEPAEDNHRAGANSWSSGDTDGGNGSAAAAMEHDGWSAPSSGSNRPMSWNFGSASAQPSNDGVLDAAAAAAAAPTRVHDGSMPELLYGPATRRATKNAAYAGPATSPYAQDHIMAERRRREKINQRFIELSTVVPGLKKMDKATILADAVKYVKELQDKLKALEGDTGKRIESVVLVKKPCIAAAAVADDDGAPVMRSTSRRALPEIEARFSERSVMVRIHCENAKGVVVRVLSEVESLHLGITHTNVMPFPACTVIITISAKVEKGFNITVEEIVGRLNSALQQHSSSEETKN